MHNLRKRKRQLLRAKRARVQHALQDKNANLTDHMLSMQDYHHLQSATNQYKQSDFVEHDNDFYDMYGSGGEHDWIIPQTSELDSSSDESTSSSSLYSSDKEFIKQISATMLDHNDYSTSTSISTSTSTSTASATCNPYATAFSSASCLSNTESTPPPPPPPNSPKRKPGRPRGSKNKVTKPKAKKLSSMFCNKCHSFFNDDTV